MPALHHHSFVFCHKLPIILLLITLAGLATVAKDGQYYRGSNPAHESSLSTKMNVTQAPVALGSSPLQRVARIFARKPRPTTRMRIDAAPLRIQPVGLRVSFSHRSPPPVVSL
jgi:hypothetical protein